MAGVKGRLHRGPHALAQVCILDLGLDDNVLQADSVYLVRNSTAS